jgi:hypothetical protein
MGNCAQFAALSGDGLPREDRRDSVAVLLAANWTEEGKVQRGCPHNDHCCHVLFLTANIIDIL